MEGERPAAVILAGPNGAGKSTLASSLLVDVLRVSEFVDADVLARRLPRTDAAAVTAGVLEAPCRELVQEFFRARRASARGV